MVVHSKAQNVSWTSRVAGSNLSHGYMDTYIFMRLCCPVWTAALRRVSPQSRES
jgi:hypothetical protein